MKKLDVFLLFTIVLMVSAIGIAGLDVDQANQQTDEIAFFVDVESQSSETVDFQNENLADENSLLCKCCYQIPPDGFVETDYYQSDGPDCNDHIHKKDGTVVPIGVTGIDASDITIIDFD